MPSLESRSVCVAGASGLVGSAIVKACLERGWRVRGTRRDSLCVRLRDIPTALRETIEGLRTGPFTKADP